MSLRFLTAGESHGPALTVIVEGLPAGIPFDRARLERDLARRQGGYGRGARMKIENDCVEVLGGIRFGKTLGSPVSLVIRNKDHANWLTPMAIEGAHPGDKAARAVARRVPGRRRPGPQQAHSHAPCSARPASRSPVAPWPWGMWLLPIWLMPISISCWHCRTTRRCARSMRCLVNA